MGPLCSVLNKWWILSAAHCVATQSGSDLRVVHPPNIVTIGVGYHNETFHTFQKQKDRGSALYEIEEIKAHYEYTRQYVENDIAVLKTIQEINFTDDLSTSNVLPVCLPSAEYLEVLVEHDNCLVSGWGMTCLNNYQPSPYLNFVDVPLMTKQECLKSFQYAQTIVDNRNICTKDNINNGDTNKGDSGGPLVCREKNLNRYTEVGIVSWGINFCSDDWPAVYANVSYYLGWIAEETGWEDGLHILNGEGEYFEGHYPEQ